jgi:predicted MFS family arabinose efflux permease
MKKSSILAVLGLSGFVVMADNWVVSPILPSIAAGIGADPVRAGLLIMAIGGSIAYFVSWRGVFAVYSLLSAIATVLLIRIGRRIPSVRNPGSRMLAPYAALLTTKASVLTYLVVLFEGILIVGSFSYIGAFISQSYHFDNLAIGLIMTTFGLMAVLGGRIGGGLAARFGRRPVLVAGLISACAADAILFLAGGALPALIGGVGLLGLGFMLAHSTLLTIATQFAAKARGVAMSLVAFAFMGGGGIGTALGGRLIGGQGFTTFFGAYALALAALVVLALVVLRDVGMRSRLDGR